MTRAAIELPGYRPMEPSGFEPREAWHPFARYIGLWLLTGRTAGAERDDVTGTAAFSWLPGGHFIERRASLRIGEARIEGVEIIGHDPASGTYPSTLYLASSGTPERRRWRFIGNQVTIRAADRHMTFEGRWDDEGRTMIGAWRPDPGHEADPGVLAYEYRAERAEVEAPL